MKIATTACCLLAALVASASSDAKTIKLQLRVNMDDKSVTVAEVTAVEAVKTATDSEDALVARLTQGHFAPSTQLTKAATSPRDGKPHACESVTEQKWTSQLNYACAWGNQEDGFASTYKLSNGTIFTSELCDKSDKAGLDKVFATAMNGTTLDSKLYDELKCYSMKHASYSVDDTMLPFDNEFNYVVHQFADLVEDEGEDDDDESEESEDETE